MSLHHVLKVLTLVRDQSIVALLVGRLRDL